MFYKLYYTLIFLLFFLKDIYAFKYAIFIPDNEETNVYFKSKNKFKRKKALKYVNSLERNFNFQKEDIYICNEQVGLIGISIKNYSFDFYQENGGKFYGRRRLLKQIGEYEKIYVFENKKKFKQYISYSDRLSKISFKSLGDRYAIFVTSDFDIKPYNCTIDGYLFYRDVTYFFLPDMAKYLAEKIVEHKELIYKKNIPINSSIVAFNKHSISYKDKVVYFYQENCGNICGRRKLFFDIAQEPYRFIVFITSDNIKKFEKSIPKFLQNSFRVK